MKHLYESILDDEEDILDDDSSISEIKAAYNFMNKYLKNSYKFEIGDMLYNCITIISAFSGDSDELLQYILDQDIMDFRSLVEEEDMNGLKKFLNFIRRINKQSKSFFSSFATDDLKLENHWGLDPKIDGKIFKTNKKNIENAISQYKTSYSNKNKYIENLLKDTKQFIYISDADDYYIICHPKHLTGDDEIFVTDFFKLISKCK